MLKKTLSWVMVGILFLSLVFNENLVTKKIDVAKKVIENIMKKCIKTSAPYSSNYFMSEQMGTLMALGVYLH